jgi:hypothetical protein
LDPPPEDDGGWTPPVVGLAPPLFEPPPVPPPPPPPVPPPVGACGAGDCCTLPPPDGADGVLEPPDEPPDEPEDELPESPVVESLDLLDGAGLPVTGAGAVGASVCVWPLSPPPLDAIATTTISRRAATPSATSLRRL